MNLSQTRGGQTSSSEVESVQIKLRIKPALRSSLEEAAKINGVSLSQEIVCRLYRTFAVEETESKIEQVMQEFGEK
ncbi:MAG: hypothetical protein IPK78_03300 [Rhodospirillales bacterium]|nr:hypothetical protein [Rhodospirillales bacterium]